MSYLKVSNHNELIHVGLQTTKETHQPNFVIGLRFDQGNETNLLTQDH